MKSLIKLAVLLATVKTIEKDINSVKRTRLNKFLENHIEKIENVVNVKDLFEEEVRKKANHSVSVDDFFG